MTNKWLPFFLELALARVSVCSIRIFSATKHSFVFHVKICLIKNANRRGRGEEVFFWHVLDFVGFRLMNWWMCKGKVDPFGRSMLCDACEWKFFFFFALRNRLSLPMSKFWRSHRPWSDTNGIKKIILVKYWKHRAAECGKMRFRSEWNLILKKFQFHFFAHTTNDGECLQSSIAATMPSRLQPLSERIGEGKWQIYIK